MTKYNESPMVDTKGYIDVNAALKLKAADGKVEIAKIQAQTKANKVELLVKESAKETASKHLAKFAGLYLTFMVMAFIFSIKFIPSESIAVVAGLITLVVSNLSMILKGIVENGGKSKEDEVASDGNNE